MSDKCPNKKECGSCEWSDVPYEIQLKNKLSAINTSFMGAGFSTSEVHIEPSPATSHYRNRMDFVIDYLGNFGLRQKGKWWKVIDNHTCFISDVRIEEAFHDCYEWVKNCGLSYHDRRSHKGLLSYIVLKASLDGSLLANVVSSSDYTKEEESLILSKLRELADITKATTLVWSTNTTDSDVSFGDKVEVIRGPEYIEETVLGNKYRITPNSFFQTNSRGAAVLQGKVMEMALKSGAHKVVDLFCGSGFFTIPLSKICDKAVGIEVVEEAVDIARINAKVNNSGAEFICSKTESTDWSVFSPELLVLDPPRSGLHPKTLKEIIDLRPPNIIYVSCNFLKFVEEFKQLSQYYSLDKSVAVDLFPHTHHVELVNCLVKK